LIAGQATFEANASLNTLGFDDGAQKPASYALFRSSNDQWAYSLPIGDPGAAQASIELVAFGVSLPPGALLTGVSVELELSPEGDPAPGTDQWQPSVTLVGAGGLASTSRVGTTLLAPGVGGLPVDELQSFGGANDLWGLPLDLASVSDLNFGVRLALQELGAAPDLRARVDRVALIIHYTTPGGTDCAQLGSALTCNLTENRCQ